jgi:hypothetical protein
LFVSCTRNLTSYRSVINCLILSNDGAHKANLLDRRGGYWQLNGTISLNDDRNLTSILVIVAGLVVEATASGTGTANVLAGDVLGTAGKPRTVVLQLTLKDLLLRGRNQIMASKPN